MKKIAKITLKIFIYIILFFVICNILGYIYALITPKLDIKSANKFYLYDNKQQLVFQGNGNEEWINLNEMGTYIKEATISVEDKNFYKHKGFDYLRITKAMLENIKQKQIVQGASTITQQYAKNLFLDFSKSWKRKWKEMWITFELETHYTKDEILEGYLNTINYGHGMYGVANASKYYFDKDVKDLTLAQAAMLAGIPNSPANYSPKDNFEKSKTRQELVLERMYKNKYISKEEYEKAKNEKIEISKNNNKDNLTSLLYYYDATMEELYNLNEIPKSYLETKGIKIYTSLDTNAQKALEESNTKITEKNSQTAKVMMDSKTGGVLGLIGGIDYGYSQYNRATQAKRQPGSTVKPFLYYRAIEKGFTSTTKFLSNETTFNFDNNKTYSPKNYGNIYAGKEITLAAALAYSDNIFAVKTHLFLGQDELVETLKKVGIEEQIKELPSIPLGTFETSPLSLATAYSTLANEGKKITPHFIEKIEDINGNVLYEKKYKEEQILDPAITFIISELLTGSYDKELIDYTYPTCYSMIPDLTKKYALKSGSTDTDSWIIGYTKDYVLVSWTGYDDNKNIENKIVADNKKSWSYAMETYLKDKESTWYKIPKTVIGVLVDPITGEPADQNSKHKKILYYINGTEPKGETYDKKENEEKRD